MLIAQKTNMPNFSIEEFVFVRRAEVKGHKLLFKWSTGYLQYNETQGVHDTRMKLFRSDMDDKDIYWNISNTRKQGMKMSIIFMI